MNICNK